MERLKLVCALVFLAHQVCSKGLDLQFSWSKINYTWDNDVIGPPSSNDPNAYDTYIYENNIPMGANRWKNKVFVSVARRKVGIPSTLNFLWLNGTQRHNPPLIPYPDWKTNRRNVHNDNDIHLISAYRMAVDECDRLWVMDDGRIESFGPSGKILRIQNPSLVVIDLQTDKIVRRHFLKDVNLSPLSSTVNIAVDVDRSSCNDAYAYIPDMLGYRLHVYSFAKDDSWRVVHKFFYVDPMSSDLQVAGMKFQWMDGIFSVGLTNKNKDGFRTAYFNAMASTHIFSVSTEILRSQDLATRSYHGTDFKEVFDRGPLTESTSSDLHKHSGVLFFGLISQNAIGCWNTNKRRVPSNVDAVCRNDEEFIYPVDVKVSHNDVIAVTNRFPIYAFRGLNYSDTNFRVFISNVYSAIKHTACDY